MRFVSFVLASTVLAASVTVVHPAPARAEEGGKSGTTAALVSLVLPGAGHLYAGDSGMGWTLLSVYTGTAALAWATNPSRWEEDVSDDEFFGELAEGTPMSTKLIFWGSAATAAATLVYAVVDAPKAIDRVEGRRVTLAPTVEPDGAGLVLAASW
ncbi:hypothetical protein HY634_01250 [Candidatus Uhrbacteria bacterium]|nr:hypothetical protein [Candidatus Uhrbacteria bacterium]